MRRNSTNGLCVFVLAGLLPVGTIADDCVVSGSPTETKLTMSGGWHIGLNWDNGAPDCNKIARIPADLVVAVYDGGAGEGLFEARSVIIESGGSEPGRIQVDGGDALRIYEDSTLDGVLCVYATGSLEIAGDVTFSGSGAFEPESAVGNYGVVRGKTSSDSLTIDSGFQVRGACDFQVNLINNGTVTASNCYGCQNKTILLTDEPKSGTGTWETEGSGAKFEVSAPVTVNGEFEINDGGKLVLIDATLDGSGTLSTTHSSAVIEGKGRIKTALINNGSVIANTGTLRLTDSPKSGSGIWEAKAGYELKVERAVTGNGHWKLVDNATSKITVDADCPCLEGAVTVIKGTLDANQDFKTSGNLVLGGIDALIDVAALATVKLGAPLAGSCFPE